MMFCLTTNRGLCVAWVLVLPNGFHVARWLYLLLLSATLNRAKRGYRSPSQRSKSRTVPMWIADNFLANTSGHIMTITAGLTTGLAAIYGAGQHRPPA